MKTAEEYFNKYCNGDLMIGYSSLVKILSEHDKEIISLIDELLQSDYELPDNDFNRGYKIALTELKQKLGVEK